MNIRLLNLGLGTAKRLADLVDLSIKYCLPRADLSRSNHRMPMIRTSFALGVWLTAACLGLAAQTQTPPSTDGTTPPQVSSPAVILPPQTSAPQPAQGQPAQPAAAQPPATEPPETKPSSTNGGKAKAPAPVPAKDPTAVGPAYVIGSEDVIAVRVWNNPDLSGTFTVGPDGMISLQLIGEVRASGFTAHQLEGVLAERLLKVLREPEVNVQVLGARSRTYIILGDGVTRPGIYPLPRPMTVLEALIAGGTFSPFAKKTKIYVLRGTTKYPFNWNEVSKGKNLKQNIMIQNGDQIYVP